MDEGHFRPYASASRDAGATRVGGAICEAILDLSHPLAFGYGDSTLAVFHRGTDVFEPADNAYATPLKYSDEPLLAGYMHELNVASLPGNAVIVTGGYGSGKVIAIADNPAFRAYWWGTQKLIANAAFFGPVLSWRTLESPPSSRTADDGN